VQRIQMIILKMKEAIAGSLLERAQLSNSSSLTQHLSGTRDVMEQESILVWSKTRSRWALTPFHYWKYLLLLG